MLGKDLPLLYLTILPRSHTPIGGFWSPKVDYGRDRNGLPLFTELPRGCEPVEKLSVA
jgi:hypothetical protein